MRLADLLTAAALVGLGGVVIYDAARLGIGWGEEGPRSGFFPFWLAVLLAAIGVTLFGQALRRRHARPFATRQQLGLVLKVVVPVALFIVLTDPPGPWGGLGLYVSAALYMSTYMRWVGRHHWAVVATVAITVPLVTFFVFERWFLVPMPKGPLEAWLGY